MDQTHAKYIIEQLGSNAGLFQMIFSGFTSAQVFWRPSEDKWNALEIACHLYDEEREDFRARLRHILEKKEGTFSPIDPQGWVTERNYDQKDFHTVVSAFMEERNNSISWLKSLPEIHLDYSYAHPKLGQMTAKLFLSNWLAHDYLHVRQLMKIRYAYLQSISGEKLDYAGPSMLP